jgi:diguanylate cyclase (GGDEF)-like protein/PAS domain S-box-containing protein
MPDGMFTIDTNLNIQYANAAFYKLLDLTSEELIGSSITDWLGDLNILDSCMADITQNGYCNDQETIFKRKDGTFVHISKNVQALYDEEGTIQIILVSVRDLTSLHALNKELLQSKTDQKRYTDDLENIIEERTSELTHRLLHNALTGLPNRIKLLDDIEESQVPHTLILINIDSFNELNTFYGHRMGDELLCAVAVVLVDLSKRWNALSVYKLPVDEYAILFDGLHTPSQIEVFASDVSHWISEHVFNIQNQQISLSITMGMAFSDANEEQNLLLRADMALKLAKKTRQDYIIYDQLFHIKEDYEKNLSWIKRLRSAIEEDRIVPFYQPIVNAKTLKIEKYEALVRIIEEDGTVITPIHFLGISKKVKLYHRITTIMIDKVFEALQAQPNAVCSINLSIEDINDVSMHDYIIRKVQTFPNADQVVFEILESEGIENYDVVNSFIREVKKYGVQIALDDFGAGYSNFAYITKLDIDYIKIDGSIIRDIHINPISQIITETIIDFATKLNIKTVAEFVCCEEVYRYIKSFPIDEMQGYYFGEPSASMEK